jgi:hypothetical protein
MCPSPQIYDERRKYQRILFSPADAARGLFLLPGLGEKPFEANIINLSMGGLHFTPKAGRNTKIHTGDQLAFVHLIPKNAESLILNIDATVVWVVDSHILDHIGIGCKFANISDSSCDRLSSYIDICLENYLKEKVDDE